MKPFTNFAAAWFRSPSTTLTRPDHSGALPEATSKEGLDRQLFCDCATMRRQSAAGFHSQPAARGGRAGAAGRRQFRLRQLARARPWALTQFGFRAVISTSFADIFTGNSLKNALLPIAVRRTCTRSCLRRSPPTRCHVEIDLAAQTLTTPAGRRVPFPSTRSPNTA